MLNWSQRATQKRVLQSLCAVVFKQFQIFQKISLAASNFDNPPKMHNWSQRATRKCVLQSLCAVVFKQFQIFHWILLAVVRIWCRTESLFRNTEQAKCLHTADSSKSFKYQQNFSYEHMDQEFAIKLISGL